jgi:hypothetical protein
MLRTEALRRCPLEVRSREWHSKPEKCGCPSWRDANEDRPTGDVRLSTVGASRDRRRLDEGSTLLRRCPLH